MGAEEMGQRGYHISGGDISIINKLNHSKDIISIRNSFLKSYAIENYNLILAVNIKNKVI